MTKYKRNKKQLKYKKNKFNNRTVENERYLKSTLNKLIIA